MSLEQSVHPALRLRGLTLVNRIVHWLSLVFLGEWALYGVFRCPFVVPFISCQNCPVMTCPGRAASFFWGFWGGWIALAILFGRAFCGWICPGGLVSRLFRLPLRPLLSKRCCDWLDLGKYVAIIFVVWAYFVLNQPRVNVPIRVGEFWPSIALTFEHAFPLWIFRTCTVLFFLAAGLLVAMAWCRFACPAGGLLELTRKFSLFRVWKGKECTNCDACRNACYMRTRPDESNCTNCGDCLSVCPHKCIHLGRKKS